MRTISDELFEEILEFVSSIQLHNCDEYTGICSYDCEACKAQVILEKLHNSQNDK